MQRLALHRTSHPLYQQITHLKLDADTGWMTCTRHVQSPNFDSRPAAAEISLLVIHGISLPPGRFGGDAVVRLFTNTLQAAAHPDFRQLAGLRVSAHLFIRREGSTIQFVSLHDRAWHAGESQFEGRPRCNDFSIGIELEGTDTRAYTARQYDRLSRIARLLMRQYPAITTQRIVGHSEIAPGRKSDPGPAFDWSRFRQML